MKTIDVPEGCEEVLLHACCAPCSSAIVEWLMANGVRPTIFYYNPNIWPREEYEIRKEESKRHAESLGIQWIDGDYEHERWMEYVSRCEVRGAGCKESSRCEVRGAGYEDSECPYDVAQEPERGRRCEQCFTLRLTVTARKAKELGIRYFATTLASSRWKSLEQIERAGRIAETIVNADGHEGGWHRGDGSRCVMPMTQENRPQEAEVRFWAQNWRKGGLQERRNQLLKEYGFYNQQYCGCEFSAHSVPTKTVLRQQMRKAKVQHEALLAKWSAEVVERLAARLGHKGDGSRCVMGTTQENRPQDASAPPVIMAYWPLKDEVDIRPLIGQLVGQGRTVLLPKVTGPETMELRRYTGPDDLKEGAFHIMEPTGELFTDYGQIDVVLVPGMAFDAAGHRLGRGKGYYDRFLAELNGLFLRTNLAPRTSHLAPRIIGVCFPFQRVAEVSTEAHDVVMDEVIS